MRFRNVFDGLGELGRQVIRERTRSLDQRIRARNWQVPR
jgi:hypothetical protein